MMDPKSQCWRKVAWALRLVPPEHGSVLERCLLEHYGRETGYVFAWANLFTRGMWCLALPMLIYGVVNVGPAKAGVDARLVERERRLQEADTTKQLVWEVDSLSTRTFPVTFSGLVSDLLHFYTPI